MSVNLQSLRIDSRQSLDGLKRSAPKDNPQGVARLQGSGGKVGQVTTTTLSPLQNGGPGPKTHYVDGSGQMRPRSITPLFYDADALKADVGKAVTWGRIRNAVPFLGSTTYGRILKEARQFSAGAGQLNPQQKLDRLESLKTRLEAWQARHGDASGPAPSPKQQAVADMHAAVLQAIAEARYDLPSHKVQAGLPHGVEVDHDGNVSGELTLDRTPKTSSSLLPEQLDRPLRDVLEESMGKALKREVVGVKVGQGSVPITNQASKDLYRLNIDIPAQNGTYNTLGDPEKAQAKRTESIVAKLRDFAGSDAATTVLTAALNQQIMRPLHDSLLKPDGSGHELHYLANRDGSLRHPDGSVEDLGRLKMYGNTAFALDRNEDGDFVIRVDLPLYFDGTGRPGSAGGGTVTRLPLEDDNVLKAHFRAEFVIDAEAARAGRLVLRLPEPPTATFSGGVDLAQVEQG